jgi:uncharacterized protein YeaO (DUF488 family)
MALPLVQPLQEDKVLKIKRAYDKPEATDGQRILIDRLWPRGISKAEAGIDEWQKDLGPSSQLRQWFNHDPLKWEEFRKSYLRELTDPGKKALLEKIAQTARQANVTLIYASKDTEHSNALVLAEIIGKMLKKNLV